MLGNVSKFRTGLSPALATEVEAGPDLEPILAVAGRRWWHSLASMHQSKLASQHKLCISDFCSLTIP